MFAASFIALAISRQKAEVNSEDTFEVLTCGDIKAINAINRSSKHLNI